MGLLESFSITSIEPHPKKARNNFCTLFGESVHKLRNAAIPSVLYLKHKHNEASIAQYVAELEQLIARTKGTCDEALECIEDKRAEIERIVATAREAAASIGVGKFTVEFNDEAIKMQKQSRRWLVGSIVLASATIAAAICLYFWPSISPDAGTSETIRNIASKAAIIAVLFTGTVWCGRIYRAFAHQAAVNKHRALSLATFQTFVVATEDKYVKDAVLMAATTTVFSNVPTGFVEERGNQDSKINFVEFGRKTAEKAADGSKHD